jgi:uncharacterized protein involved in outer membrane biogenesis
MALRRRWKLLLGIVVVLVVAAVAVPVLIPMDHYRGLMVGALEEASGRKVRIESLRLRLLPTPGVEMHGAAIYNPPGFPQEPMLTAESLSADVSLGELLRGDLRVTELTLTHPVLTIVTNAAGASNLESPQPARKAAKATEGGISLAGVSGVEIRQMELRYGTLVGNRVVERSRLTGIDFETRELPLSVEELSRAEGKISLKGVELKLAGIAEPMRMTGGSVALKRGAVRGELRAESGRQLGLTMDGTFDVPKIFDPTVRFDLHSPEIDLDRLAQALSGTAESAPAAGSSRAGGAELVASGRIRVDKVKKAPYEAANLKADLRVYGNRTEVKPIALELYGGTMTGSVDVDRSQAPAPFHFTMGLKDVDVARLAATSEMKGKMEGKLETQLEARGVSEGKDWERTITGAGSFAIRDGRFGGFSMGQQLSRLVTILTLGQQRFSSDTPFSYFGGDLEIANGRVVSKKIELRSPNVNGVAAGSFGFDGTVQYQGEATLSGLSAEAAPEAAGASRAAGERPGSELLAGVFGKVLGQVTGQKISAIVVPFSVTGTSDNPKFGAGKGLPRIVKAAPTAQTGQQPAQQQLQEQKPRTILDLFRRKP